MQLLTRHFKQLYERVYITAILNIFPTIRIVGRIAQMYTDLNEIIRLIIIKIKLLVKIDNLNRPLGSSLENYKTNNTSQHEANETTRHNTSTTRDNTSQHDTTRVPHDTTRHDTSKTQDNASITRPNTSTMEAQTAKIGFYFTFFVT